MTRDEFNQWLENHCAAFTGLKAWMYDKIDNPKATAEHWYRVLREVDLDHCLEATNRLFESEKLPAGYDRHPLAIRKLAKQIRHQRDVSSNRRRSAIYGVESYSCQWCADTGFVSVRAFGAYLERCIRTYGLDRGQKCRVAIGCCCSLGDGKRGPRFDPTRYEKWDVGREMESSKITSQEMAIGQSDEGEGREAEAEGSNG